MIGFFVRRVSPKGSEMRSESLMNGSDSNIMAIKLIGQAANNRVQNPIKLFNVNPSIV